jgi:hypothetical protein
MMEIKVNEKIKGDEDSSLNYLGRGLQFMIQTPLFIIVGIIVVVWETVSKLFQTVYSQGAQYSAGLAGAKPAAAPTKVKVPILPIDNYSRMDVDEVIGHLEELSVAELGVVKHFESSHENRAPILEAIEKRVAAVH